MNDALHIRDCMKTRVFAVGSGATVREAVDIFLEHRIGLLPVIDETGRPVGVLGLRDVINLVLPDFVHLIDDLDFVPDFGAVELARPDDAMLSRPISELMRPGVTVPDDCGLLRAHSLMLQNELVDLPVTDADGRLIGIASRVDIGCGILSGWQPGKD